MSNELVKYFAEIMGGGLGEQLRNMADAEEQGLCPKCNNPVSIDDFKMNLEKRKFKISGLCPICQKEFLMKKNINNRPPNFIGKNGRLFLVRCYACDQNGKENYAPAVATGICAWCGWPKKIKQSKK